MEQLYTHKRGLRFFLDCTGAAFEGRYPGKTSDLAGTALEIMKPQWLSTVAPPIDESELLFMPSRMVN